jgi:hypothetical protein
MRAHRDSTSKGLIANYRKAVFSLLQNCVWMTGNPEVELQPGENHVLSARTVDSPSLLRDHRVTKLVKYEVFGTSVRYGGLEKRVGLLCVGGVPVVVRGLLRIVVGCIGEG